MTAQPVPVDYDDLLGDVLTAVKRAHTQLVARTNATVIELYWNIGRAILTRQVDQRYGTATINRLSTDLKSRYPGQRGFSPRNLWYMRAFAAAWPEVEILQRLLQNLGWGQNQILLDRLDNRTDREWYAHRAISDGWTHAMLNDRVTAQLHLREGNAPTNFAVAVPQLDGEAVLDRLATDPYRLDFVTLDRNASERDLETALVERVAEFLTHLGRGFAYMGRQHRITVGDTEFHLDLLFYNVELHAYVVFELKTTTFAPAQSGQLAFYVTAIERQLRREGDGPTIGVLLVADKDNVVVDYALAGIAAPIAVASYTYQQLPDVVRARLPNAREFEALLEEKAVDSVEQPQ
jgi:predicted nuclease of restriction endonuclease-like (RecB) superfamily